MSTESEKPNIVITKRHYWKHIYIPTILGGDGTTCQIHNKECHKEEKEEDV